MRQNPWVVERFGGGEPFGWLKVKERTDEILIGETEKGNTDQRSGCE